MKSCSCPNSNSEKDLGGWGQALAYGFPVVSTPLTHYLVDNSKGGDCLHAPCPWISSSQKPSKLASKLKHQKHIPNRFKQNTTWNRLGDTMTRVPPELDDMTSNASWLGLCFRNQYQSTVILHNSNRLLLCFSQNFEGISTKSYVFYVSAHLIDQVAHFIPRVICTRA